MKKKILMVAGLFLIAATNVEAKTATKESPVITSATPMVEISSFCMAIVKGDIDAVRKFIEFGEDVNKKSLGLTPVIYAARYNQAEILKLLIANGANINKACDKGRSPMSYAEMSNSKAAIIVLEKAAEESKKERKARKKRK